MERGEGWHTRMERFLERPSGTAGAEQPPTLVERHVLTRPGEKDVVIHRYFTREAESDAIKAKASTADPKPMSEFEKATRPLAPVAMLQPTLSRNQ